MSDHAKKARLRSLEQTLALAVLGFFDGDGVQNNGDNARRGAARRSEANGRSSARSGREESPGTKGQGSR